MKRWFLVLAVFLLGGSTCRADPKPDQFGVIAIQKAADIGRYLADFNTFNGEPLYHLLQSYGLQVKIVLVEPPDLSIDASLKPDDRLVTVQFRSHPNRKMPCHLERWLAQEDPQIEILRRGVRFPVIERERTDPLTYWAATGKCTRAYSY